MKNGLKIIFLQPYQLKLDQAIRARRKRFFLMEKNNIPRKNPLIWNMLFGYVFLNILEKMKMTLSETITYMIDERESKAQFENQMAAMKTSLKNLLK